MSTSFHAASKTPHAPMARAFVACSLFLLAAGSMGCPSGQCWMRFQQYDANGRLKSNKCLVDSCPKNAAWVDAKNACECKGEFVPLGGACQSMQQAVASCGVGYAYANGGCIAKRCAANQVLNTQTGNCDNKADSDQAVAASAGVTLQEGQTIGCPAGQTYVVNGRDGACIPDELMCGEGTTYQNGRCVPTSCPAGTVYDANQKQCIKLATTQDSSAFSVQTKLAAELGPAFCAPHAKNPAGFGVQPGGQLSVKVAVTIAVPGNEIEKAQIVSVHTTNAGGAELPAGTYPEVANVNTHVQTQVINDIKALGGKSIETQASAEVTCVIKRAPIQVVSSTGGGV